MNRHALAYSALAAATLGWALSPIFMRYMTGTYDPYTQSFLRYAFAMIILLGISAIGYREGFMAALRRPRATVGLAALNFVMQTAWTVSLYHTTATAAQLITKIQVLMIIAMSYFLYQEERAVIRSPRYIIGTALGFIGLAGVLMDDPSKSLLPTLDIAVFLLLFVSVCWSIYAVWGKHVVKDLHPVPMFTVVSIYTTVAFGVNMLIFGSPGTIVSGGSHMLGVAALSSVLPIAVAHAGYHYAQHRLGAAFCISVQLITPAITNGLAVFFWPDERMNAIQWIGAGILTTGSFCVIQAQRKASAESAPLVVTEG